MIKATEDREIVADVANETYRLVFKKALLSDDGYYKVIAKNNLGESSSEARLKAISKYKSYVSLSRGIILTTHLRLCFYRRSRTL